MLESSIRSLGGMGFVISMFILMALYDDKIQKIFHTKECEERFYGRGLS